MNNRMYVLVFLAASTLALGVACSSGGSKSSTSGTTSPPAAATSPAPAAALAACRGLPALPPESLTPEPTVAGVPASLAAYLGAWEGFWNNVGVTDLIVQSVTPTNAKAIYIFGGQMNLSLDVQPDGSLQTKLGNTVQTWALSPDGKTLTGTFGPNNTATLTRCAPLAPGAKAPAPAATSTINVGEPDCKFLPVLPPTALQLTPPPPDLPAALTGLTGVWEGTWSGTNNAPSSVVVQKVSAQQVTAIYTFAGQTSPMNLQIQPDGKMQLSGNGITFVWTFSADKQTLDGVRTQAGTSVTTSMKRCHPAS